MKLHFLGANRQVTGSCYCLETASGKILVDCGLFQERPFVSRNWAPLAVPPAELKAIVLTHVHIDHLGRLPRLVAEGFSGPIFATHPSVDLAEIMLEDAAEIQVEDAAYKARRHAKEHRRGPHPEIPLFTPADVARTMRLFRGESYDNPFLAAPGVEVTFRDAGHILGSSSVEIRVDRPHPRSIVFSGDIGQWDKPLIRDPAPVSSPDYLVMESTYGGRNHPDGGDIELQLAGVILRTADRGGNVVIPTFAVERAQELMFYIGRLARSKAIPRLPVFLDSPMAVDATEVYLRHLSVLDQQSRELIALGTPPLRFPGLQMTRSQTDSKEINDYQGPCIIMATSGMCTAGRIKHHLRKNLPRRESTILFVGYQAEGTLGRQILEGQPSVRIHGQQHPVRAEIAQIFGFSGHADHAGLLRWASAIDRPPRRVFLTHGEASSADALAKALRETRQWNCEAPTYLEVKELE